MSYTAATTSLMFITKLELWAPRPFRHMRNHDTDIARRRLDIPGPQPFQTVSVGRTIDTSQDREAVCSDEFNPFKVRPYRLTGAQRWRFSHYEFGPKAVNTRR